MNTKLVFILSIACGILSAVIVAEWGYALHVRKQALSPLSGGAVDAPLSELPTIDLLAQPEQSYVDFVERPLFIKGRKPVEGAGEGQHQTGGAALAGQFDWQLVGVYTNINDNKLQALFAREKVRLPKDNFRKLAEGALLDGWHLLKIEKDKATLNQDGNQKILFLHKPKPKQLPNQMLQNGKQPLKPPHAVSAVEPEEEPIDDEEEFLDE